MVKLDSTYFFHDAEVPLRISEVLQFIDVVIEHDFVIFQTCITSDPKSVLVIDDIIIPIFNKEWQYSSKELKSIMFGYLQYFDVIDFRLCGDTIGFFLTDDAPDDFKVWLDLKYVKRVA